MARHRNALKALKAERFRMSVFDTARPPLPADPALIGLRQALSHPVEAASETEGAVVQREGYHAVIEAAHLAAKHRRPLLLSPELVEQMIVLGLETHLLLQPTDNGEYVLRNNLERCKEFIGSYNSTFHEDLRLYAGWILRGLPGDLSRFRLVPGGNEIRCETREHLHMSSLDRPRLYGTLPEYFKTAYSDQVRLPRRARLRTACVTGSIAQWRRLVIAVSRLIGTADLDWWLKPVQSLVSACMRAKGFGGPRTFARQLFHQNHDCWSVYVNGTLMNLIPYVCQRGYYSRYVRNPLLSDPECLGVLYSQLPASYISRPFTLEYQGHTLRFAIMTGFLAVTEDSLVLRPQNGWALVPRHFGN